MKSKVVHNNDGSARLIVDVDEKDFVAMGNMALDRAVDLIASGMAKEFREKHGKVLTDKITETMEEMLDIAEAAVDEDEEET